MLRPDFLLELLLISLEDFIVRLLGRSVRFESKSWVCGCFDDEGFFEDEGLGVFSEMKDAVSRVFDSWGVQNAFKK